LPRISRTGSCASRTTGRRQWTAQPQDINSLVSFSVSKADGSDSGVRHEITAQIVVLRAAIRKKTPTTMYTVRPANA
jgi:hypothetical protein